MEPVAAFAVPQGEQFLYQIKWDGVRVIAHTSSGRLMLHNRKLRERTHHYPELDCLKSLGILGAVFDGEVVALKDDRPSFPLVLRRDQALPSRAGAMRRLVNQIPILYLVFDIIYYHDRNLMEVPFSSRQELLAEVLPENDYLHRVENFRDGASLFKAVSQNGLEGIVAKEKTSSYIAGRKQKAWQKVKVRQKQLVAVGGYTKKAGMINSLLAGAYFNGRFICVGRVATGLSVDKLAELSPFLKATERSASPFANESESKDQVWVEPKLTMLVEFQEWTEHLRMRQPVIKGFTKDNPQDCVLGNN